MRKASAASLLLFFSLKNEVKIIPPPPSATVDHKAVDSIDETLPILWSSFLPLSSATYRKKRKKEYDSHTKAGNNLKTLLNE